MLCEQYIKLSIFRHIKYKTDFQDVLDDCIKHVIEFQTKLPEKHKYKLLNEKKFIKELKVLKVRMSNEIIQ